MDKIRNYDVQFSGLREGEHHFSFNIKQAFFDLFTFEQEFEHPDLNIDLVLFKRSTFLELTLQLKGEVELVCDITNEPYMQAIEGSLEIVVKFGEEFDDSDDEVLILPHGAYKVNVAQLIFELALLSIPLKHINPNLDSEEAKEALNLLEEYEPMEEDDEDELDDEVNEKKGDPRWEKLKDLLNNNEKNIR